MAVTYTTAALVRKLLKEIDTDLVDADIEQHIYEAESLINATMRESFIATFDATKHALIRSCATELAAFQTITYDPGALFLTLADAEMAANLLWNSSERDLKLLEDPRTVAYLNTL